MTIYNIYIFDQKGSLLYYHEWNRIKQSGITKEEASLVLLLCRTYRNEAKLMYGMLFSIKSFVNKISPIDTKEGFLYYKTSKYTLHYLETPSSIKFVLNTDNSVQGVRDLLQQIYNQIYVEYVIKNPLNKLNEPIQSELFKTKLDAFIKQSPSFMAKAL